MQDEDDNRTVIRVPIARGNESDSGKREANLLVMAGATIGVTHKLPYRGDAIIGRGDEAAVRIGDEDVSRSHARISIRPDGQVTLTDLGSTNGTYVNGVQITEHILHDGEKIQLGPRVVLKFQYQDALEEEFQRKLFESAVKDGLTGIYNKKYFLDRIEADIAYAKRHYTPLVLLLFDIDHFKQINDTFGHAAGDHVLKHLAATVKRAVRTEDSFARFGGEEFAILMRGIDDAKALMSAERLRRLVEKTEFEYGGKRMAVTISIGIGVLSTDPQSPVQTSADLVNRADHRLYEAKRGGRNRVVGKTGG
jgi:two-component system cell cycle response regulator